MKLSYFDEFVKAANVELPDEWRDVIDCLANGNVPKSFPDIRAIDDLTGLFSLDEDLNDYKSKIEGMVQGSIAPMMLKDAVNSLGMFGYISEAGAKFLAKRYEGKTIIDPMAGRGWFAKAMRAQGVKVIAGDLHADKITTVTDVLTMDAEELVSKYKDEADILMLNWSPYDEDCDFRAASSWGADKLIVFYGELGMCCGSPQFASSYSVGANVTEFPDLNCAVLRRLGYYEGHFRT
ncbi:conserved hypothetical protein [Vibrio chagasii]|nr:conserved hypothetical protein [Vibrio chagasii]